MTRAPEVSALLSEASRAKCLILSRRELRAIEEPSTLKDALRDLGRHSDDCRGSASLELFGPESSGALGDAPAWVDAGALHEGLIAHLETHGPVDFVFCLDPWAAQLLSRMGEGITAARWILVSDLAFRKDQGRREYWNQMDEWFKRLSFAAIIPRDVWDQVLAEGVGGPTETPTIHLAKHGAWQWRRISGASSRAGALLFLVQYSDSLARIKVFLDSLARQDYPRSNLHVAILVRESNRDLDAYLRWFALAHPEVGVEAIEADQLTLVLDQSLGATLVLVDDSSILPDKFARAVSEAAFTSAGADLCSVPLNLEASAHIITGNLDPLANYEKLLLAFQERKNPKRAAQIIPSEAWENGVGEVVPRILRLAQEAVPASGLALLQLAELT
jgi:hypothetical protein